MKINLDGEWKGWPASKGPLLREFYQEPDLTSSWLPINVPGNWQRMSGFGNKEHIVYYYHAFSTPIFNDDEVVELELSQIFNHFTLYLNGIEIGAYTYYFRTHMIDITKHLNEKNNHLFLKVASPLYSENTPYSYLGLYGNWEYCNPHQNPGGICAHIKLNIENRLRIVDRLIDYQFEDQKIVRITSKLNIASPIDDEAILDWELSPLNFSGDPIKGSKLFSLKKGPNHCSFDFVVNDPKLWSPWEQGDPNLYQLILRIYHDDLFKSEYMTTIGFKRLEVVNGIITINRKNQFIRGIDYIPPKVHTADITIAELEKDIQMILDAGFNTIRLYQHLAVPELYQICNENGLMIWQDIPYFEKDARKYSKNVIQPAVNIYKKYHTHPAIFFWGLPDSGVPALIENRNTKPIPENNALRIARAIRRLATNQVAFTNFQYFNFFRLFDHSFNRNGMEESFKLALERTQTTRGQANIISHWGYPAYPEMATMNDIIDNSIEGNSNKWIGPPPFSDVYFKRMRDIVPAVNFDNASEFYMASQNYQARLLRYFTSTWRTHKYQPFSGCFVYFFGDNSLTISDSIVDYYRRPKQGYTVLKKVMQPIMIFMEWPDDSYRNGDIVKLKIMGINDTANSFPSSILSWQIKNTDKDILRKDRIVVDLMGDDALDLCALVWEIDESIQPGLYTVDLKLELSTQESITNSYQIRIEFKAGF